jgi:hypothetical protein
VENTRNDLSPSRKNERNDGDVSLECPYFEAATKAFYFAENGPVVVFGSGTLADDEGLVAYADREYISRSAVREAAEMIQ